MQFQMNRWRHACSVAGLVALATLATDAVPCGQGQPPLPAFSIRISRVTSS